MTTAYEALSTHTAPAAEKPKPNRKRRAARRAKATPARRKTTSKKARCHKKTISIRPGSKTAKILALLKRPGGATAKQLMKATGWKPHSVRGFLSGTVGKKMGLTVTSTKSGDGERSYSMKA
jgi:hypothetical protein